MKEALRLFWSATLRDLENLISGTKKLLFQKTSMFPSRSGKQTFVCKNGAVTNGKSTLVCTPVSDDQVSNRSQDYETSDRQQVETGMTNYCKVIDYTDFSFEQAEYGNYTLVSANEATPGASDPIYQNWDLPILLRGLLPPNIVDEIDAEYKAGAVAHPDDKLVLTNSLMNQNYVIPDPNPFPFPTLDLSSLPGAFITRTGNFGVKTYQTLIWEVTSKVQLSFSDSDVRSSYLNTTEFPSNDTAQDPRIVTPGFIFSGHQFIRNTAGQVVKSAALAVCIFFAKNAVWAFYDVQWNTATREGFQHARKIATFDTSVKHTYAMVYNRRYNFIAFYIDGSLKLKHSNLGYVPTLKAGDMFRRTIAGAETKVEPSVFELNVSGGNRVAGVGLGVVKSNLTVGPGLQPSPVAAPDTVPSSHIVPFLPPKPWFATLTLYESTVSRQ